MVRISDYTLIRGLPISISPYCTVRQPHIDDIDQVTYEEYQKYLSAMIMTKEDILKSIGLDKDESLQSYTLYQVVSAIPMLRSEMAEAFSFFMTSQVVWRDGEFMVGDHILSVNELNDARNAILKMSYIDVDTEESHVFADEQARRIWEKCQRGKEKLRKTKKQDVNMEVPNLIASVCARGFGYTMLNIGQLTIYQLYDQFSRMNTNVQMDIYATRWAAWGKDAFDVDMWFKNIIKKEGNST